MTKPEEFSAADRPLREQMRHLDPPSGRVAAIKAKVLQAYADSFRFLSIEWLRLIARRPVANTALVLAASVILFVSTPLGALTRALVRHGQRMASSAQTAKLLPPPPVPHSFEASTPALLRPLPEPRRSKMMAQSALGHAGLALRLSAATERCASPSQRRREPDAPAP